MSSHLRGLAPVLLSALIFAGGAGCGGDHPDVTSPDGTGGGSTNEVRVEGFRDPQIAFDPSLGTTTVIVQLVARDGSDHPLADDEIQVDLQVDGSPIDVEGLLSADAEQLASSLHLTLVLDASYSMLQHEPAAFLPMLSSARNATSEGKALYVERPGTFEWDLMWFNDRIYRPVVTAPSTDWLETDIERIPAPSAGTFTKLYAALLEAVESSAAHAETAEAGERDQHLVVVFSDGADNYSWFDNAAMQGSGTIGTDRGYEWHGAGPVTRADVEQLLREHPEVQLHVMGLGSAVNDTDLSALSRAGRGRYFKNLDTSEVDTLFDQVTREFTSVQTRGATIPLAPGTYTFRAVITRADTGARAIYEFRFLAGEVGARVLD